MEFLIAERISHLDLEELVSLLEKLSRENPEILKEIQEALDDL
jgi:hypothetical protein